MRQHNTAWGHFASSAELILFMGPSRMGQSSDIGKTHIQLEPRPGSSSKPPLTTYESGQDKIFYLFELQEKAFPELCL